MAGSEGDRPPLRAIAGDASPEEVAAIVAAVAALTASAGGGEAPAERRSRWVDASRLRSRRAGLSRGEWRLSGRIGRRARA
jgi:hypothetical protein